MNLGPGAGRGHPRPPALARRPALERGHELHAGGGGDARAARAARRHRAEARAEVRLVTGSGGGASVDGAGRRASLRDRGAGPGAHDAAPRPLGLPHLGSRSSPSWSDRFRVLRYDLRGYGRSSRLTGEPYSHVRDLATLLEALEIERTALVGCSMGGAIAIDFTLSFPERVSALVLGRARARRVRVHRGGGSRGGRTARRRSRRRSRRASSSVHKTMRLSRLVGAARDRRRGGPQDPRDRFRQHPRGHDGRERRRGAGATGRAAGSARSTFRRWS